MAATQITGLGSGIEWAEIVDQLMEIEKRPLQMKQIRVQEIESEKSSWSAISSQLSTLQSTMEDMDELSELMVKKATSSLSSKLSVEADENATPGIYDVSINRLANGHKMISGGLSSLADTLFSADGTFTITGESGEETSINVTTTTTLSSLKRMINGSSTSDVTASIMNDGSDTTPYRLILTSKETGEDSVVTFGGTATWESELYFRDSSIADPSKDSGTGTSSMSSFGQAFTGMEEQYTFTVTSGGSITAGGTGSAVTLEVTDSDGTLVDTINILGTYTAGTNISTINGLEISFDAGTLLDSATQDVFSLDVTDRTARDSELVVENITIVKDSNSIDDIIEGITLNLLAISGVDDDISVVVENDKPAVKKLVEKFISQYNLVISAVKGYQKWDDDTEEGGPLFGNSQASSIVSALGSIVGQMHEGLDQNQFYKTITQAGIELTSDGRLELDTKKLDDALDDNYDEVIRLFTLDSEFTGTSSSEFIMRDTTKKTQGGTYDVSVTMLGGSISSATINGVAATINGSFIIGADGDPSEGLMIGVEPDADGTYTASLRLSTGKLVELINTVESYIVNDTEDENDGTIPTLTAGLDDSIESLNNQIEDMALRLDRTRTMMEKKWLAMEMAVSSMKSQSAVNDAMIG